MEKEVTPIESWSMLGDVVYKVLWFGIIILTGLYVVRGWSISWIIVVSVIACGLKTLLGLFNFSFLRDVLHYYCDLFSALLVGWGIGDWFNSYLVGFYNLKLTDYILPIVIVIGLNVLKFKVSTKRSYKNLFI